ncbi:deoxyribodipyrimidine photo-lyase [Acinetobacter sp. SWAC5]|nr:deoxyribodipyrimidine photo-lyase [Acinetobacter sp. SWAC5]
MMQLVWFRNDLRIQDHSALYFAQQNGPCMAVVILSPDQWKLHQDATIKIDFYLRQLAELKKSLCGLNIPLHIQTVPLWQDIPAALKQLCQRFQIKTIHCNIENGWNEKQRDLSVATQVSKMDCQFEQYTDRTIFPLHTIRNKSNQPYQVFSAFKKNCIEQLNICVPQALPAIEAQQMVFNNEKIDNLIPSLQQLGFEAIPAEKQQLWPVGEQVALDHLMHFIDSNLVQYDQTRDFPAIEGTSQLSVYLNIGILSIRQCLEALFNAQQGHFYIQNSGQQFWLNELLWREFYQHVMADFSHVSKHLPFKRNTENISWLQDDEALNAWKYGQTGIPIVDAGMRQMLATGWMHNRVRMICAMFLAKNLLIDWRKGEAWFMQQLVDGDFAANNGGWQWSASTGTDSVPYFRVFNPTSQSQKFDAQGDYIRRWVPELASCDAKQIHEPYAYITDSNLDYPHPIIDLKMSRQRAIATFKMGNAK